jgi:hypothetical protein
MWISKMFRRSLLQNPADYHSDDVSTRSGDNPRGIGSSNLSSDARLKKANDADDDGRRQW